MRSLFLALMIVLLPLRGWVGDAMAMTLLAQPKEASSAQAKLASSAHLQHRSTSLAGHDCEHAAPEPTHQGLTAMQTANKERAHSSATPPTTGDDCSSCAACQICHSLAMAPVGTPSIAAVPPSAPPLVGEPAYASADRALSDKPPIS